MKKYIYIFALLLGSVLTACVSGVGEPHPLAPEIRIGNVNIISSTSVELTGYISDSRYCDRYMFAIYRDEPSELVNAVTIERGMVSGDSISVVVNGLEPSTTYNVRIVFRETFDYSNGDLDSPRVTFTTPGPEEKALMTGYIHKSSETVTGTPKHIFMNICVEEGSLTGKEEFYLNTRPVYAENEKIWKIEPTIMVKDQDIAGQRYAWAVMSDYDEYSSPDYAVELGVLEFNKINGNYDVLAGYAGGYMNRNLFIKSTKARLDITIANAGEIYDVNLAIASNSEAIYDSGYLFMEKDSYRWSMRNGAEHKITGTYKEGYGLEKSGSDYKVTLYIPPVKFNDQEVWIEYNGKTYWLDGTSYSAGQRYNINIDANPVPDVPDTPTDSVSVTPSQLFNVDVSDVANCTSVWSYGVNMRLWTIDSNWETNWEREYFGVKAERDLFSPEVTTPVGELTGVAWLYAFVDLEKDYAYYPTSSSGMTVPDMYTLIFEDIDINRDFIVGVNDGTCPFPIGMRSRKAKLILRIPTSSTGSYVKEFAVENEREDKIIVYDAGSYNLNRDEWTPTLPVVKANAYYKKYGYYRWICYPRNLPATNQYRGERIEIQTL